jgi:hypothetical protein
MVYFSAFARQQRVRIAAMLITIVIVLWVAPATVAHADSPFDDPQFRLPSGGTTSSGERRGGLAQIPAIPAGFIEIPPPQRIQSAPLRGPSRQQDPLQNPNDPLAWLSLGFNPGKWLLDSVLGAVSGILLSLAGVFQTLAVWAFGVSSGGNGTAISTATTAAQSSGYISDNIIFSTPLSYTLDWGGGGPGSTQWVHAIVRLAAISILTLIFVHRVIRLMSAYNRQAAVDLAFAFVGSIVFTQASFAVCELMIKAANAISSLIVNGYTFWDGTPLFPAASPDSGALLSLTSAIVLLAYWFMMGLLVFKAIGRLVLVNLLIMVSPLVSLGILSGGWNYARIWFFRLVELLITPVAWAIVLGYMRNLIGTFGVANDPLLGFLMGTYALYLVPKAPEVLGLAAREGWNHIVALATVLSRAAATAA